jgi:hypothetical protein
LPDGAEVEVVVSADELSADERAELHCFARSRARGFRGRPRNGCSRVSQAISRAP